MIWLLMMDDVRKLIEKAAPDDTYYFRDIKVKCPGDMAARTVNNIVFQIKE